MEQTLLLNATYEPLKVVHWQKAITLWCQGKVEVISVYDREVRSVSITFKLPSEELEKTFIKESTAAGFDGLKGHRSVGGIRASIYNAFPEEGIDALVQFMQEFERKNG